MTQLQAINYLLQSNDHSFVSANGIDKSYFPDYENEFTFMEGYWQKYGQYPSRETMLGQFPKLQMFNVSDSRDYLLNALREEHTYALGVPILQEAARIMTDGDSRKAMDYLRAKLSTLNTDSGLHALDLVSGVDARLQTLKERVENAGSVVVSTGLKELDDVLGGGFARGEELATIVARTGQGKTWMLVYFLLNAWKQGLRVGLYSGEMSPEKIGYRFDTFMNHFSNNGLVRGEILNIGDYENYAQELKKNTLPFLVITPKDLGGYATVSQLAEFCESNKLDILGIDQFSLMRDERRNKNTLAREELEHISADLYELSLKRKMPILAVTQSNRNGVGDNAPQIENIFGSDAIGQNSTKIISIRQKEPGIELQVVKNRDGADGAKLTYAWDIDQGHFDYFGEGGKDD